jgi:hypothetical protein
VEDVIAFTALAQRLSSRSRGDQLASYGHALVALRAG